MTEGEAEYFVRFFEGALTEFGAIELSDQVRRAVRNGDEDFDNRGRLSLLLDELESVLIDAPMMLKATMSTLRADRLTLTRDPSDIRFAPRGAIIAETLDADGDISITNSTLEPLLENAEHAAALIAELRRRIYE